MKTLVSTLIIAFSQLSLGQGQPYTEIKTTHSPKGSLTTEILYSSSNRDLKLMVAVRDYIHLSGTSRLRLGRIGEPEVQKFSSTLKQLRSDSIEETRKSGLFFSQKITPKDLISQKIIGVKSKYLHLGMLFTKIFPQISGVKNCGLHCAKIFTILLEKKDIGNIFDRMLAHMHLENQAAIFPELFAIPGCSLNKYPFYLISLVVSSSVSSYLGLPCTIGIPAAAALGKYFHLLGESFGSSLGIHPKKIASIINQQLVDSDKRVVFTGCRDFSTAQENIIASLSKKEPVVILINTLSGSLHYVVVWGYKLDEEHNKNIYFILDTKLSGYKLLEDSLKEKMTISNLFSSRVSSPITGLYPYNLVHTK